MPKRDKHSSRLDRRKPFRRPRKRILIVCEGEKTEVIYFGTFNASLRAVNVGIEIYGRECGSDPKSVVTFAAAKFREDSGYDVCFCVVDRDNHPIANFSSAKDLAKSINEKLSRRDFHFIVSNPCIEYWFLLHFLYGRAPYVSSGSKSSADKVLSELELHFPGYTKSGTKKIAELFSNTDVAISHAEKAFADAESTGEFNPSTMVHEVVKFIRSELQS